MTVLITEQPGTAAALVPTDARPTPPRLSPALVVGADGLRRPRWAASDPLLRDYYDQEWGSVVTDERTLFEMLALECFQTGLSWTVVLRRRPALRAAFGDFDPDVVAAYDAGDLHRLLGDPGIIRNRRKIEAVIANARVTVELRADGGLAELIWSHMPATTPRPRTQGEVPLRSDESAALAARLKARGFRLVGPVTMQALLAAAGVVDCHLVGSHRRGCSGLWTSGGKRRSRPVVP